MAENKLNARLERAKRKIELLEGMLETKTREAFEAAELAREAYGHIDLIFQSVPNPIIITDMNLRVKSCNELGLQKLNLVQEQIVGKDLRSFLRSDNRDWENFSVEGVSQSNDVEFFVADDNLEIPVLISVSNVRSQGFQEEYVFILNDISHRFEIEQEKERLTQRLERDVKARTQELQKEKENSEQANRAKSLFLANMSHEIRTPLNALTGIISVMQNLSLSQETAVYTQKLEIASESLMGIVNNILDLTKIETGEFDVEMIEFDLIQLIRKTAALFEAEAARKNLKFSVNISDDMHAYWVSDPVRIRQVIVNLLSNAIKFTNAGRVEIIVSMETCASGKWFNIDVLDTGVGIDNKKIDTVFNTFTQEDSSTTRLFGGSGLGLSICKHVAEILNGTIDCESVKGKGSRFMFRICAEQIADLSSIREDSADQELQVSNILVVEDNDMNQYVMRLFLDKLGQRFKVVDDGQAAIDEAKRCHYDLVFMDCQMPLIDGFEATRTIRSQAGLNQDTPILAMTANVLESMKQDALESGMDDYVTKPLTISKVRSALYRWQNNNDEMRLNLEGFEISDEEDKANNEEVLVDWSYIEELDYLSDGKDDFASKQIDAFAQKWIGYAEEERQLFSQKDWKSLSALAHRFRTSCGIVGAMQSVQLCSELEKQSLGECEEKYRNARVGLEDSVVKAQILLQEWLAKHRSVS